MHPYPWSVRCSVWLTVAMWVCSGCNRGGCPTDTIVTTDRLWASQDNLQGHVRSLKAEARVEQWGRKGRIVGTVLMFLQAPDRVRFDVMTHLGPAATLTSDGKQFQLLDKRKDRFVQGQTCPANIERLLGIGLSASDVFRLLTGQLPQMNGKDQGVSCKEGVQWLTRSTEAGQEQRIGFKALKNSGPEPKFIIVESSLYGQDGKAIWKIHFGDHKRTGDKGSMMPRRIRFIDKRKGSETIIRIKSLSIGVDVLQGAFVQTSPPGMEIENALCDPM